jgi:hypothetical protein
MFVSAQKLLPSLLILPVALVTALTVPVQAQTTATTDDTTSTHAKIAANYVKIPLSFEANQGQADPGVQFLSRNSGYSLFLTPGEAVLTLQRQNPSANRPSSDSAAANLPAPHPIDTLRMKLFGASTTAPATGLDPQPGIINYFLGNDPKKWNTGIPTFGKVNYADIYPGIDLVFYGNQRQLEYDFIVGPGSDPARIAWSIEGAKPQLDKNGDLELNAPGGPVRFFAPVAYQVIEGKRQLVSASYAVAGRTVRFAVGQYDRSRPLIIDPVLSYFSYLGGTGNDYIGNSFPQGYGSPSPEPTQAVGIDSQGNLYVAGNTTSTDFPVAGALFSPAAKGSSQSWAFVSKFSPDGSKLLYSTYLGGSTGGNDRAYALAVDSTGNAYVTGLAGTNDFPVTSGAFQTICAPTRDNNTGNAVATCTFNTGNGNYSWNAFALKLNPTGSTLIYSSFLGGYAATWGTGIAIDGAGQAYVTGVASASLCGGGVHSFGAQYECFPTTSTALISDIGGGNSTDMAFMTVFNSTGSGLVYSTLFGDTQGAVSVNGAGCTVDCSALTYGTSIALDPAGDVYIGGRTTSAHLVITTGAFNTSGSGPSPSTPSLINAPNGYGYVAKFAPVTTSGTSLIYSTYFGGGATSGGDVGGLAGDSSGNAYVTGATYAADFPATPGAYQTQCDPTQVATFCALGMYVAKLNSTGTGLVWATYLGNASNAPLRFLGPVVVDSAQDVYVLGEGTGQLPLGGGSVSTLNGPDTVYVAKLNPTGSQVLLGATAGGPGNGTERAGGFAVDALGSIYVAGSILPGGSFATPGAFQPTQAGGADAFVAKIVPFVASNTVLAVSPATANFGQSVTLTATVTGPSGAPVPTGTVTFNSGTNALGTGTLNASGIATYTTSTLAPNNYSLTAAYGGDATYSSSTSAAGTLTVTAIGTSTALTVAPNPAVTGQAVTFTALVTSASGTAIPTGTVTFLNGTATLSAIAVDATGKAIFSSSTLAAATYNVTAMYSGDTDHATSTSSAVTVTVTTARIGTTTALTASATTAATGASITFTAAVARVSGTGIPTGTVTFLDGATTLGTGTLDATGKTTYQTSALSTGSHSITAAYGGDALNAVSTSSAVTVTITAPAADFSLSVAPTTGTVSGGSSTTLTVTITPINGFSAATGLSCANLPTNAACSFNSATVTPKGAAATSTLTITTNGTVAAGIPLLLDSSSAAGRTVPGVGVFAISGLSLVLVGWIGFKSRKLQREWLRYLGLLFFTVAVIGGAIGCGGSSPSSSSKNTPAGSYSITVQATSGSLSHSATYTMTVSN